MKEIAETLYDFVQALETLNLPYAIMGGFAVRVYGIPRSTQDVDIIVLCSDETLQSLFREIEDRGYAVDEVYRRGGKDSVAGMPLVKCKRYIGGYPIDVDIFLCESLFQHSLLNRRRRDVAEDHEYWLVSPEHLLLLKLIASRPRDYLDAKDVLFTQGQLDEEYLRHWAKELGVLGKLEQVLKESREM
ncbi:MAG: nucleotidyl transferase AbiEii/AbiGii toxin family protein [Pirellulales bacterium]